MGNVSSTTDANGAVISYQYDNAGNVAREIDPLQSATEYPAASRGPPSPAGRAGPRAAAAWTTAC